MLSQVPSPTAESFSSTVVEAPSSPRQDTQAPPSFDNTDGPSSSAACMSEGGAAASTDEPGYMDMDDTPVDCGNDQPAIEAQGGSEAAGGNGGEMAEPSHSDRGTPMVATAPAMSDEHRAALGLVELSSSSSSRPIGHAVAIPPMPIFRLQKSKENSAALVQPVTAQALPSINTHLPARKEKDCYPAPLDSPMDFDSSRDLSPFNLGDAVGSIPSPPPTAGSNPMGSLEQAAPTSLGKHPRPQSDIEEDHSRPTTIQKCQHEPSYEKRTSGSEIIARVNETLAQMKELMDEKAKRHREVAESEEILNLQVKYLRERVQNFEEEKQAALDMQRRQLVRELRPGLVTMKMNPRVQARVNKLFGSTGNAGGPISGAATSRARGGKKILGDQAAYRTSAEARSFVPALRGLQMLPTAAPVQGQGASDASNPLPPMGFFKAPVSYRYPEPYSNEAFVSKASKSKASTSKASTSNTSTSTISTLKALRRSPPMDVNDHDSGEETEATDPTESSAVSTESSYCPTMSP